VELLARHFLRRLSNGGELPFRLSTEAAMALEVYPFPGNVRELENAMMRAAALCSTGLITLDCLPPNISEALYEDSDLGLNLAESIIADRPTMEELQRRYLQLILNEVDRNRRRAASLLGLNRRTIQRLIARYDLGSPAETEAAEDSEPENEQNDHTDEDDFEVK
jgi:DNA-binding NtrC family response regulator